jgi:hypothetical protein
MDNRLKFGLLIGLASAVFTLLLYVVGVDDNKGLGMISFLILFGGLWLGIKKKEGLSPSMMLGNKAFGLFYGLRL